MTNCPLPCWKATSNDAKQTLILDAALRVFGTRGFDAPTMDDVAAEAGYSRRSLYRFYPSKEELGVALALRSCQKLQQAVGPLGSAALFDIAWTFWQFSLSHPEDFRVVLDTRQLMLAGGFGTEFASRSELERESLVAALGYLEFRFHHRAAWQESGLAGTDDLVKTVLKKLLTEENS